MRVFNFAAGPATLPLEVLQQAQSEMTDWKGSGMSVMEVSHRSKAFIAVAQEAEADLRELLAIPANYKVLFLQGGATGMFSAIPMNLATAEATVDYVNTGAWSKKAIGEAKRFCKVNVAADEAASNYIDRARAGRAQAHAGRRVFPLHAERDHRRRGVRLRPESRMRRWSRIFAPRSCRVRSTSRSSASSTPERRRTSVLRASASSSCATT